MMRQFLFGFLFVICEAAGIVFMAMIQTTYGGPWGVIFSLIAFVLVFSGIGFHGLWEKAGKSMTPPSPECAD